MTTTIDVPGGSIAYRSVGDGPVLVLLTTLAGTWRSQVQELGRDHTVVTYDMRGFGASSSDGGTFPSNEEHADDLARLLDALGVRQAAVAGLSHGGIVAQHFAARHGERLRGLALVATLAHPQGSTGLFLRMLNGFLEDDDVETFWRVLKAFLFSAENAERLLRHEGMLRRAMFDQYTAASLRSIYGQALTHDSRGWLDKTTAPTIVIGGQEDALFPPAVTSRLAELIPGSQLVMLPAAHVPPVETPDRFNEVLAAFLEAL